jgi:hypothetical protein
LHYRDRMRHDYLHLLDFVHISWCRREWYWQHETITNDLNGSTTKRWHTKNTTHKTHDSPASYGPGTFDHTQLTRWKVSKPFSAIFSTGTKRWSNLLIQDMRRGVLDCFTFNM